MKGVSTYIIAAVIFLILMIVMLFLFNTAAWKLVTDIILKSIVK